MSTTTPRPQPNGLPKRPTTTTTPTAARKPFPGPRGPNPNAPRSTAPRPKAASIAGGESGSQSLHPSGVTGAYAIMASRIANRVAEMAESITFVERPKPQEQQPSLNEAEEKRRPRKLEMRLPNSGPDSVAFSAPFLDNTLQKMLALQNRMLRSTAELTKAAAAAQGESNGQGGNGRGGVSEKMIKEHAAQSAELSRIIALICAEKARQGA